MIPVGRQVFKIAGILCLLHKSLNSLANDIRMSVGIGPQENILVCRIVAYGLQQLLDLLQRVFVRQRFGMEEDDKILLSRKT